MKTKILTLASLILSFGLQGYSQDKPFMDDLYYYLENTEVFEVGQEDGRALRHFRGRIQLWIRHRIRCACVDGNGW